MSTKRTVAIIAKDAADREEYERHLSRNELAAEMFSNLEDLRTKNKGLDFCGAVISLRDLHEASAEQKRFAVELEACFPVLRVVRRPKSNEVSGVVGDRDLIGSELFDVFSQEKCLKARPRGVRSSSRHYLHLNVEIAFSPKANGESSNRTNTLDVSEHGAFLVTLDEQPIGDTLWVVIKELEDATPIQTIVRWCVRWGETYKHLPGLGVQFIAINERQHKQLMDLVQTASISQLP